ncbi:MAG TPA: hypothetical protein VFG83_14405 [Kofleriaceae bacterium]|nr:hypothetical protein [Kofleriaceae bacterium]
MIRKSLKGCGGRWAWGLAAIMVGCGGNIAVTPDSGGPGDGSDAGDVAGADATPGTPGSTLFPPTAPWYEDISGAAIDPNSDAAIAAIEAQGGWGNGDQMQIDFGLTVLYADAAAPMRTFDPTGDFYTPDCDHVPVPVPAGGMLEGESGYACTGDGDCHLLVIDQSEHKLYEMWRANITGDTFEGGCLAVWDLSRDYAASGRGEGCTSADAGGLPMTALLFTADEVAAGHIDHAIRFILPNDRIGKGYYVHPATHSTFASEATTAPSSPPYGARLRLRADYPIANLPSPGAQVVARAMQKYGMILSDGGQIALTAASDRVTENKWDGLLDSHDLAALEVTDFVMVDGGEHIPYTEDSDCIRTE